MDCLKATPTALLSTPSNFDNLKFYEVDRVKHLKLSISDVIMSFNLDEMVLQYQRYLHSTGPIPNSRYPNKFTMHYASSQILNLRGFPEEICAIINEYFALSFLILDRAWETK